MRSAQEAPFPAMPDGGTLETCNIGSDENIEIFVFPAAITKGIIADFIRCFPPDAAFDEIDDVRI